MDGGAGEAISAATGKQDLKDMGVMELGFRGFTYSRAPLDSYEVLSSNRINIRENKTGFF
ncbi:MAG: hypothetical protein K5905_18020 [Roseibium sp.]|uniref:hypothetical protein n=1 Tax=Roseibium sp. TaxID=1936156 RepID=UPI002608D6D8|nr:hypothetical protein [Roseibium sp.]MCV0427362.1 hypothetical protein [Roseibium sp.]